MYSDSLNLEKNYKNPITIVEEGFLRDICYKEIPVGTKIMSFNFEKHSFKGVLVYVSHWGNKYVGKIQTIDKDGYLKIAGNWVPKESVHYVILG